MKIQGSLTNRLLENAKQPRPQVGMGATQLMYSDRHAYTIIEVSEDGKEITLQQDSARRTDDKGESDSQDYEFTPNPDAPKEYATLRSNGAWVTKESSTKDGIRFSLGHRDAHYDFTR